MDSDTELVRRCIDGEESAWGALLEAHTRRVYNLCYRFTGRFQDAEDLTQEVFIKIFQTLRTYDQTQATFAIWLNRIARNHLIDHYRRTKRDRATFALDDYLPVIEQKPSSERHPLAQVELRERNQKVQTALNELSPELREAVILRDFQDLDYPEIAQVLHIPEGTVKSRISRGRRELARVLKRME